jgi:hypothetical protein
MFPRGAGGSPPVQAQARSPALAYASMRRAPLTYAQCLTPPPQSLCASAGGKGTPGEVVSRSARHLDAQNGTQNGTRK